MVDPINPDLLDFDIMSNESELSVIDVKEEDELDTLGVRDFLTTLALVYKKNYLTSVWKVSYEKEIIAFFTISMNSVGLPIIPTEKQISEMKGRYPAVLLGQMWVDKKFRRRHVSYWISQYVTGLARRISPSIACSCIILQTDKDERKIRAYRRANFVPSKESDGKIWMYQSTF